MGDPIFSLGMTDGSDAGFAVPLTIFFSGVICLVTVVGAIAMLLRETKSNKKNTEGEE